jgi:hypothetical protein
MSKVWILCFRVADRPRPAVPSDRQQCANCREPIWVAKESPAEIRKVCTHCIHKSRRTKKKPQTGRDPRPRLH